MESSLILQEKPININKTKLNIDFCQIIFKFGSICFIISQLTKYNSELKHNYSSLKDHLKELARLGLLKELEKGLRSGKNYCTLYMKPLPESLSSENIQNFSLKYLNPMKISWPTYFQSCQRLILPSKSAVLSPGISDLLNNDVYRGIVQQQQTTRESTSTNKIKAIKNCTKISKINSKTRKIEKNQNSILKYFHPIISTTSDSSKRTNKEFSNIFNDDDSRTVDISSSPPPPHQSSNVVKSTTTSNIIKSKYFRDKIIQTPCPNTLLVYRNK